MTETDSKTPEALRLVKRYMLGSLAVGVVPMPVLDMAVLTGVQLKMLHGLAALYDVPFSSRSGRSVIASLVGGGIPITLTSVLPVGQLIRTAGMSVFAGASTYAIGRVFMQDFESGGEFLTLKPEKIKRFYDEKFDQGKQEVRQSFAGVQP